MKVTTSKTYLTNLDRLVETLGYPVFIPLREDFVSEEHFPGSRPQPLKRLYSDTLLYTVEFAYALCNTDALTTDPYVHIRTPLGFVDEDHQRRLSVDDELHPYDQFEYVKDMPFYLINRRNQAFAAEFVGSEEDDGDGLVYLSPVDRVPKRSLVLRLKNRYAYQEWELNQTCDIWSDPNQLINLILRSLVFRNMPSHLSLQSEDIGSSPGVTIEWDFDSLDLALYHVPLEKRIKADEISRKEYVAAFDEAQEVVVRTLTELNNVSKNKAIVEYARSLILKELHVLKERYG